MFDRLYPTDFWLGVLFHFFGCLENDDLENDDKDGVARRIKG